MFIAAAQIDTFSSVTNPGVLENDVIIAAFFITPGGPVPSGWTLGASLARPNSQGTGAWYYKIATASEPATWNFGSGGNNANRGVLAYYRDEVIDLGTSQSVSNSNTNPVTHTIPLLANTIGNRRILYFGTGRSYGAWFGVPEGPVAMTLGAGLTQRFQWSEPGTGGRNGLIFGDEFLPSGDLPARDATFGSTSLNASNNHAFSSQFHRRATTIETADVWDIIN